MIKKYGPEPENKEELSKEYDIVDETMNHDLFERINSFYKFYNADKVETVKDLVSRTKNNPKYEARLIKMLVKKYGPEPGDEIEKVTCVLAGLSIRY